MKPLKSRVSLFAVLAVIFIAAPSAHAFYELKGEGYSFDARSFVDFGIVYAKNPDAAYLYKNNDDKTLTLTARLMADATIGDWFAFEFNGLGYGLVTTSDLPSVADVERSSSVEWGYHYGDHNLARVSVDHLNVRFSHGGLDLIAGRQAINFATCFYFTPNDLFAPFSAQTFFRVYKPGVDAARLEVKLGQLSQLTLVAAEGYAPDASTANGWSMSPDGARASFVARAVTTFSNFQWGLLAGRMAGSDLIGGSMQGELFNWLGVRGEGNVTTGGEHMAELAIGVEHRFNNGLSVRYEQFYNGAGAGAAGQYQLAVWYATQYHGMNYGALGFDYQFTPLLSGGAIAIANYTDGSAMAAFNAVYSLSNNSELWLGLSVPYGAGGALVPGPPPTVMLGSEYGAYPAAATFDLRMFF